MKFLLGIVCGVLVGVMVATTWPTFAQLAPFDAPLAEQLNGQRQEHYLRMERQLERQEAELYRDPLLSTFGAPCR